MKQLERTILSVLRDALPHMMPEPQLFAEVNLSHHTGVTRADFNVRLAVLEQSEGGAQIVGIATPDLTRWKITAEGLARLAGA